MVLKQKLFFAIFIFLVFFFLLICKPSFIHAATPKCEDRGITINYKIIPQSNNPVVIGKPVTVSFEISGLKSQNINTKLHFNHEDHGYYVCNEYTTPPAGLSFDDSGVARGEVPASYSPKPQYVFPSIISAKVTTTGCQTSLLYAEGTGNEGEDFCYFQKDLDYPHPKLLNKNVYSPVEINQPIPVSGIVNYIGQVCIFREGKGHGDDPTLGCTNTSSSGTFSLLTSGIPDWGTQTLGFFTANNNNNPDYYKIGEIKVFISQGSQPKPPTCGVKGTPCCTYYVQAYGCTEGNPSDQTANCICSDYDFDSGYGDQLIPTSICKFSNDQGACEQCVNENKVPTPFGCISAEPQEFVEKLLKIAMGVAGGIAFLMILYGGFTIMMSAGNPEKLNSGKEIITSAISGLLLIVFSAVILRIIGIDILGGFPGFGG
ncbi:MAG: hypothetical protein ACD_19C00151G0002 [uncultured bacterium]|nr:MAG: hypothetical protein ACD_19C00151G0002 [uncultured bacterium]